MSHDPSAACRERHQQRHCEQQSQPKGRHCGHMLLPIGVTEQGPKPQRRPAGRPQRPRELAAGKRIEPAAPVSAGELTRCSDCLLLIADTGWLQLQRRRDHTACRSTAPSSLPQRYLQAPLDLRHRQAQRAGGAHHALDLAQHVAIPSLRRRLSRFLRQQQLHP